MSHSTYPSLRQLADQFAEMPEYTQLRTYIRGTIDMSLGGSKRGRERELTDRECITHSLVASWLQQNGYHIASQMMKTQMSENYQENPEKHLQNPAESIEFLLKNNLKLQVPKLNKTPKTVQTGPGFPKINPIEMKREPIKISPLSDEEYKRTMRQRMELERARLARMTNKVAEEVDSDDSDDSSQDSSSDDSTNSEESPSDAQDFSPKPSDTEEKLTFSDILKSSKTAEEKSEKLNETPVMSSSFGGSLEFLGNPAPKAWGPSKNGLVTDSVSTPSDSFPSLFNSHLPSISMSRPTLKTAKSEEIDALFEEDMQEYLGEFEDSSDDAKTPKKESLNTGIVEKPVNVVPPVVKREEPMQVEPVVLSEGESIDELEDFDTADLSSGGSDFSF